MTVHGVHGWSETDKGAGTIARLAPYFDAAALDFRVFRHEWPRLKSLALLAQRRRTREEAARLAGRLSAGDSLVTFSNGAAVARHALMQSGERVGTWVAIAPALPRSVEWPDNVDRIVVMHSSGDWAVRLGRAWTWINPAAWVLGHDWGDMGRAGYTGDDPRVENWAGRYGKGHVGWFDAEALDHWGPKMALAVAGE